MAELSPHREFKTTGSQAPIIIAGSEAARLRLWEERVGLKPPEDMSDNLPVQIGKLLEPFLIDWVEKSEHAEITERQRFVEHPTLTWCSATIDGYRAFDDAVIEAKVIGPWRRRKEFLTYYTPQVAVQMACRQCTRGILAVLQGNSAVDLYDINPGPEYLAEMWTQLAAFQLCVDTMTPPSPLPEVLAPPEQWRTIDLLTLEQPWPNWAQAIVGPLSLFCDTKDDADINERAREDIKALLPPDVGELYWDLASLKRNRRGAVTITLEKET